MDDINLFKIRLERERKARKEAESILEKKALELFKTNEKLKALNSNLEKEVADRSKALIESEKKYRGIIENMELGLLEVDRSGVIIRAYDWFCDMVGYSSEELEGQDAADLLLTAEYRAFMAKQDENRKRGQNGIYEIQIKKKNGELIWVLISGAPFYNKKGEMTGSIGIHLDITKRKLLEEELKSARYLAEKAEQTERQFLANMSHEIRTPLNAIIGMSHLLYDQPPAEQQKEYLDILKSSATMLHRLLSDIIDLSKINAGQMEINPSAFDLKAALRSICKSFELRLDQSKTAIQCLIDPKINRMLVGDELLLHQILFNLMGNAVKFTLEGQIELSVQVLAQKGPYMDLEFAVTDTGIGMTDKEMAQIFQYFKQAHKDIKSAFGGFGLGLTIAKQLIELQGGRLNIESQKGRGSRFSFQLRYEHTQQMIRDATSHKLADYSSAIQALELMIVEDNLMNRKYIAGLLDQWKVDYEFAIDGQSAIALALKKPFDLILMDLQLPDMSGFEIAAFIKDHPNPNRHSPIVALTASALTDQKQQAMKLGMQQFLSKPFNPKQLAHLLAQFAPAQIEANPVSSNNFSYHPQLDHKLLEAFYGEDWNYAADMFSTFLEQSLKEYQQLDQHIQDKDWKGLKALAHKLKPCFSMVGLPQLEDKMQQLEQLATNNKQEDQIIALKKTLDQELAHFQPLLLADLNKMQALLNDPQAAK
ncbi:MAG: ATP-binding protein [Bacteroidota bacterium]